MKNEKIEDEKYRTCNEYVSQKVTIFFSFEWYYPLI